jgi:hypothetical protein
MGDFNATPKPTLDREHTSNTKPESQIYHTLKNNFYDSFRTFHPTTKKFTCTTTNNKSRIDQIWIQDNIMPYLLSADITPTNNTFYSDHKITSITLENFLETKGKKRNHISLFLMKNLSLLTLGPLLNNQFQQSISLQPPLLILNGTNSTTKSLN